ncbi:unnamed protein product [Nesidiocoris tenuis]|uniref:BRCT domain-containing protein n=1 Tax=Nesidiocoris tenuis TaxID=355587 RepID=A0A6H5GKW2_9HEMI|nr:unnamed protein product [Nesidiocoris tenuis]
MPRIKLDKVISVSSEDPVHTASNLLKGDYDSKKWKSKNPGEKKICAVFKFFEPATISSVDVGNENSAFIEILVSRSASGSDDYQVLLPATTMMTLREAKFSENTNAVKFFKFDDFCADTRDSKWDQVMIVCTQPYNVVTQFGLSFVLFHTDDKNDSSASSSVPDLGKFRLKPLDQCGSSSVVSAWGMKKMDSEQKAQKKTPKTPRNRKDKTGAQAPKRAAPPAKGPSPSKKPKIVAVSAFNARSRPKKPFHHLMSDVVFVISGFQNPMRSDLRNAALAMGAKYKADWDNSCTHLVCAFRNTPKFNQVGGRGKIVKKDWIESCYESRKRFPWRRYALDPSDQGQNESEEEIWEDKGPSPTPVDNRKRLNDTESEDEDEVEKEVKR